MTESFIHKICAEKKLELVESSREISESYNTKSTNTLKASKLLIKQNLLEEAVTMAYFGMYNKAQALLYRVGIKCENHTATIILLKELFNLDNTFIRYAKVERIDKQYYPNFTILTEDVQKMISTTERFIEQIDEFLDKLREKQIVTYREKFKMLIKK